MFPFSIYYYRNLCLLLGLLSFSVTSFAQNDDFFKVEKDSISGQPTFYHKRSKKASGNINTYLQLSTLHQLRSNLPDSLILEKWNLTLHANNKRYLSLSLTNQDENILSGANNFLFNSATGEVLGIQDIFVSNGIAFIKKEATKRSLTNIRQQNLPFNADVVKKSLKNDLDNFMISADTLAVYTTNTFSKDSLGNLSNYLPNLGFSNKTMSKFLSTYGQAMFAVNRKLKMRKMHSNSVLGLYHGKIESEAIVLQLENPLGKELKGTLYFPNTKKAIALHGVFKSNRFEAQTELGKLNLYIISGIIQGNLRSADKKISYLTLEKK